MGKWIERLRDEVASPPYRGTDRTDRRGLLTVLAVESEGSEPEKVPIHTEFERRRLDVLARLLRWGWPAADAEATAARIAHREPAAIAGSCVQCAHYRPGRCDRHRQALLSTPEVGRDLAQLTQNCPAYTGLREIREPRQ